MRHTFPRADSLPNTAIAVRAMVFCSPSNFSTRSRCTGVYSGLRCLRPFKPCLYSGLLTLVTPDGSPILLAGYRAPVGLDETLESGGRDL